MYFIIVHFMNKFDLENTHFCTNEVLWGSRRMYTSGLNPLMIHHNDTPEGKTVGDFEM